jgi:prolyl oligopeptidase
MPRFIPKHPFPIFTPAIQTTMIKILFISTLFLASSACFSQAPANTGITYPATRKCDQTDTYFGTAVPDPYRWL